MAGFFEGAMQGYDKGSTLGAQLFRDAMAERNAEKEKQAMEQRHAAEQALKQKQFEREMGLKERAAAKAIPGASTTTQNTALTPGRKAADVAFGKEYADWSSGGLASTQKGLSALESAKEQIKGGNITGPVRGAVPDVLRAFTNPQSVDVKENIRAAVQNTLKATLGAQFTEKEGERIFNFAYNDRLPAEQNIARLDRLIKEIKQTQEAKQSMADYFEQQGTLTGWQGRPPSISQIGSESLEAPKNDRSQALQMILADPEATPEEKARAQKLLGM